ncbi:MAG: hypothetical protein AAF938_21000, partial [Myxococcota bacterium]
FMGSLDAGASFVICNGSIPDATNCDETSGGISHNGNDAYAVRCDGTIVDSFGDIDPTMSGSSYPNFAGTNGDGQALSGAEQTLRRDCSVTMGDTDLTDAFDLGAEWDASVPADPTMSRDDLSGLGGEDC